VSEEDLRKQLIPMYWIRPARQLSAAAGMHRWIWDLHYPSPATNRHDFPIAAIPHDTPRYPLGPTAVPGSYMIRLTVDGKSFSAPLIVKMDPRIKTSPAGLLKKFQVETRLALLLSESAEAVGLAGSIHEQLEKLEAKENSATDEAREAFEKKLKALQGGAGGFAAPPSKEATLSSVNGEAGTLYQQVWGADAEPTSSQMQAIATTERESEDVLKRWNAFKNTDLPAFNRALHEANVPEIKPEVESLQEETQIDED
jgi:hypothetical protein